MGALHKAMVYLGFSADEGDGYGYDDYGDEQLAPVTQLPGVRAVREAPRKHAMEADDLRRIQTVKPRTYSDARMIGEAFRQGIPVIMNLTEMADADAKRLVDFAAGLTFGLEGSIERVTTSVFLMSPAHVEIGVEAEQPVAEPHGLFNQS